MGLPGGVFGRSGSSTVADASCLMTTGVLPGKLRVFAEALRQGPRTLGQAVLQGRRSDWSWKTFGADGYREERKRMVRWNYRAARHADRHERHYRGRSEGICDRIEEDWILWR